jgi:kynurenine formamidase
MRLEHLEYHMNRRSLLATMAKAGAAGALLSGAGTGLLGTTSGASTRSRSGAPDGVGAPGDYDDIVSVEGALNGEWAAATSARYGAEDERGTLNEITPEKTARALCLLEGASAVHTFGLGHLMVNGFPAYVTFPPRLYSQRLVQLGYEPADPSLWFSTATPGLDGVDEWRAADRASGPLGYSQGTAPLGANMVSGHEERFLEGGTYQIATQLDNLSHIGVGDVFYNGFRASEVATPLGMSKLGMHAVTPFVTRGVLLDVLGWKMTEGGGADVQTVDGHDMLADAYRVTLDDLQSTMAWAGVDGIEPGDVVLIRTGWWWLAENPDTYERYLTSEPGIHVAEAKWLGDHRPALVGSDAWGMEVVGNPDLDPDLAFPCHTELIPRRGVRIGESVITDALAERGVSEFVYSYAPQWAWGATAGNTPPVALVADR